MRSSPALAFMVASRLPLACNAATASNSRLAMGAGRPAGANSPLQLSSTKPGGSDSANVGTSGKCVERAAADTASARTCPCRIIGAAVLSTGMPNCVCPLIMAVRISLAPL
ncbi:hypothetical protein D3C85_1243300 [compost metagenome]